MIPWFQYTTVYLGPLPIRVWGFFVALGIAISLWIVYKKSKKLELNSESALDAAFYTIVVGIVGARLFHIVFYEPMFFIQNPIEMLKLWHGGMSSYGGFFGAVVGFVWYAKRKKLLNFYMMKYADLFAYASIIGWMIARVGCFMIHDHIGKPCNCFLAIDTPIGPRLDMALLELIALIPLAVYVYAKRKKQHPHGFYLALICVYYGVIRFVLDFWRATDIAAADVRYFYLTPAQYMSIVLVGIGLYTFRKIQGKLA